MKLRIYYTHLNVDDPPSPNLRQRRELGLTDISMRFSLCVTLLLLFILILILIFFLNFLMTFLLLFVL
jgi:hypothetical protein